MSFKGNGARQGCLLHYNLSTPVLELSVSPQLESSLGYDSHFIVCFSQDQMDISPNLKMYFPVPP